MKFRLFLLVTIVFFQQFTSTAQTTGIIVRPGGSAGPALLDPNGDGYTSINLNGFGANDISNSEIQYKTIAPLIPEPSGDLLRGPASAFSDIVRTFDGSGFYLFADNSNLYCRLRIGNIVSGSKGYSVLIDTDQKFGPSGPSADPNFLAATNGNNGNPGFEFEVVLETNFRVAIYNVDGTSTPVLVASYPINSNSQVSMAATTDGGNPDYFYDFVVPFGVMGLTSSTPIRVVATTVMSPGPAIGGPKSDIYGLSGNDYMNDWTVIIENQPPFTPGSLTPAGTGVGPLCTKAPVLNDGLVPSSGTISGTWTKSTYSSITSAKISVYINGIVKDSVVINSGSNWSITVSGLVNGQTITATAQAIGESMCLTSNPVIVNSCNNATHSNLPVITCSSIRGLEGTMDAGASVKLYKLLSTGLQLIGDDATTTYRITYPTTTTWRYDDANTQSGSACTGGPSDVSAGAYVITAQAPGGCVSNPLNLCISGTAAPLAPTITSALVSGTSTIKGTATASSGVNLWLNGYFSQSVTANASGVFTFTLTSKLAQNDQVSINSVTTGSCASASVTGTVSCYIAPPVINVNDSSEMAAGIAISGRSSVIAGSTITIYNAATSAVVGTTTVSASGTFTLSSPLAVAGINYFARITGHACGNSLPSGIAKTITSTSAARCGSINDPLFEADAFITGTIAGTAANTVITLYVDGLVAGKKIISSGSTWSIPVNTNDSNKIYTDAILQIGIKEPNKLETFCAPGKEVLCSPPTAPVISPVTISITAGQAVTYTVTASKMGILYTMQDASDNSNLGNAMFGNGSNLILTTLPFNIPGTYNIKIKGVSLSGSNCFSSTSGTVTVTGVLPLNIISFSGRLINNDTRLTWVTSAETGVRNFEIERSRDGRIFQPIGFVNASGINYGGQQYNFDDVTNNADVAYYRLKINDNSVLGYSYSKVVLIKKSSGIAISQITPNPFDKSISINCYNRQAGTLLVTITDIAGRKMKTAVISVKQGDNTLLVDGLQGLASGTYVIEFYKDGKPFYKQMMLKK